MIDFLGLNKLRPRAQHGYRLLAIALLFCLTLPTVRAGSIPGITLVSPADGTIVRPGESVLFEVEVDPNLLPAEVIVLHPDMRYFTNATLVGPPFAGYLPIPDEATGPMEIFIGVIASNDANSTGWATLTLKAIPLETPVRLDVGGTMYLSYPMSEYETRQILVRARYADESSRDVTLGLVGTTYASSDPAVVTVDQDGLVTPTGPGLAYVLIEHQGVRTYAQVKVRGPTGNRLQPIEYTTQALISPSGFRRDPGTAYFVQQVSIYNDTELPFPQPLHLVINDLPEEVKLVSRSNKTRNITPLDSPYVFIDFEDIGPATINYLAPGNTTTINLMFWNPKGVPITHTLRLFGASGDL